jgi:hypothetical protein
MDIGTPNVHTEALSTVICIILPYYDYGDL